MNQPLSIVILAAGAGKRMYSQKPKVLFEVGGKPMLRHVVETAQSLNPESIYVVVGAQGKIIREALQDLACQWVEQATPRGTGDALLSALPFLKPDHQVLVLYGDVPLLSRATLVQLMQQTPEQDVGVLTAVMPTPFSLGRIIRDNDNNIKAIVEERDATDEQKKIIEINTGIYAFPSQPLKKWLNQINNDNVQGEYYLTDVIEHAVSDQVAVHGVTVQNNREITGVNDKQQLAQAERYYQLARANTLMQAGVTFSDPARFDVRGTLEAAEDVSIDVNVVCEGDNKIGARAKVGANVVLKNVVIEEEVEILPFCSLESAHIKKGARIGPYARIRPDSVIGEGAHIGNFVEIKKSVIAAGSKANHLSYIGDTTMGKNVNVGAGTITCNYDGIAKKYETHIGDNVSIGSNTCLVAPVTLEAGAFIGAGSVITRTAPCNQLSLSRAQQKALGPWPRDRKKDEQGD